MTQLSLLEAPPARDTLADARRELMERGRWTGVRCPCCDQLAKVYARRINATMARSLIRLHRAQERAGWLAWLDLPALLETSTACGDAAKLRYWGLIESKAELDQEELREDGSPRTGRYRVTALGSAFVRCTAFLPARAVTYGGELLRLEGELLGIRDALGKRFSYEELMAEVVEP